MSNIARAAAKEEKRLWSIYAFIICGAVFVVSLLAVMLTAWTQAERENDHAFVVLSASNRVLHGLENAALSQRNYIVTKDPAYLHSYQDGVNFADKGYGDLLAAIGDDEGSAEMLQGLATSQRRVIEELQTTIALIEDGRANNMLLVFRAAEENLCMFDFKTDMGDLLTFWRVRRAAADADTHWLQHANVVIIAAASALTIVALVWTGWRQGRALHEIADAGNTLDAESTEDPLTGLANRRYLLRALDGQSKVGAADAGAMLYMDIDGFKAVNDALGHAAGDEVLKEIAKILQRCVRSSDVVARVGGDEFVIFLPTQADEGYLSSIADRLIAEVRLLGTRAHSGQFSIGLSVGISRCPDVVSSASNLLSSADAAMYFAKRNGKNRYQMAVRPAYLDSIVAGAH
jgi:diguanylate cyclase (GGDEF)-like protein